MKKLLPFDSYYNSIIFKLIAGESLGQNLLGFPSIFSVFKSKKQLGAFSGKAKRADRPRTNRPTPQFMRVLILLGLFFTLAYSARGQNSTLGKEFWVGFMENDFTEAAVLVITADEQASGAIEYLGQTAFFDLQKGEQYVLRINPYEANVIHETSEEIENKGVYITSSGRVAVHAFNEQQYSADGTVVLPVKTLGKEYFVTSYYEEGNGPGTLLIVAIEDNTKIEITTPVNTLNGKQANIPFSITLDRGQSYQVKAFGDLTGAYVKVLGDKVGDCGKIAVFGGNLCTTIGDCLACDHLFQQTYPISTWGTSYIHVGLKDRTSGELVRILASEDGTDVIVAGENKGKIGRGESMTFDLEPDKSCKIETSNPSSVTVFSKGAYCNSIEDEDLFHNGDPFMITYSPSDQFLKDLVFNSMKLPVIENHYVNIVVKSGTQGQTRLDGNSISGEFSPLPGDGDFQIARVSIAEGAHHLENPEGFAAYAYGFGRTESYGYAAGAALDNLNLDFSSSYEFDVTGEKVACLNQEGAWTANISDPLYKYIVWDFGDGTDLQYGREVFHTFSDPGKYIVSVTASKSPNSCDDIEEASLEVAVLESKATLEGEVNVCPDVEEIMYRLTDKQHIAQSEFEAIGGEIIENYGDSILVKWGKGDPKAKLIFKPFSENGCPGEQIELEIILDQDLRAFQPIGPEEVCFDPNFSQAYSADPIIQGRIYEWEIMGGKISSGQGTGQVEVIWDKSGIEGVIGYTVFSDANKVCSGNSPVAKVKITDELASPLVTNVACFGESSGKIKLDILGGNPPYNFEWKHDPSLSGAVADNLPAGTYSVLITDNLGCSQLVNGIEVEGPALLEVNKPEVSPTTCLGRDDGMVRISISGGVSPYHLTHNGLRDFEEEITLYDLAKGSYSIEVFDQNGCLVTVDFEITSPPILEAEVRLVKPACPGGQNGALVVDTEGIIGAQNFYWSSSSGQTTALATDLEKGAYEVGFRDVYNCIYVGRGVVEENAPEFRMPTGFDPRQVPGVYSGVSNCEVDFDIWIYNRWGELIYFGDTGWDGKMNGKSAPVGSYAYMVRYYYTLEGTDHVIDKDGAFMLVR
ncbi:PKD domain-containing protein [Echinicola soli]|uniref:PKD domain-containing protein n=1 Tax=Echinicola soli TaxID=2591634 RepID=A0A514CHG8_9BACT|nr:PKD domain-containing protein [Echinicola soli]QDH79220.1 PKD domain-containing protein [Echinicola soli]